MPTCEQCQSSVRHRSIIHLLTRELFGRSLSLRDVPVLKQIKGLGMTDWLGYGAVLSDRFSYINTFFDREPRFDITAPSPEHTAQYDFLISSEVFEHVHPPVEVAFENAVRVLKPNGFLILTVPYEAGEVSTVEHFPELDDCRIIEFDGEFVLVNRRKDGSIETSQDLIFHNGPGNTLEMRVFAEIDLLRKLTGAGFREAVVLKESYQEFGVLWHHPWSRPIIARKERFGFSGELVWKLAQELCTLRQQSAMASRSRWLALGRALRVGPNFGNEK